MIEEIIKAFEREMHGCDVIHTEPAPADEPDANSRVRGVGND